MEGGWEMTASGADFISTLNLLSTRCGNAAPDWPTCEYLDHIEWIDDQLDREIAIKIGLDVFQKLWEIFQDAISLKISIGDLPVFELGQHIDKTHIQKLIKETDGSSLVKFALRINKCQLAGIYFQDILTAITNPKQIYLYFFSSRCSQYLNGCSLEMLEQNLWGENGSTKNILFLLPAEEICLVGPRLIVLGGHYINAEVLKGEFSADIARAEYAYTMCRNKLRWHENWLQYLTPWHVFTKNKSNLASPIGKALDIHFINAFLLYTADFTLEYASNPNLVRASQFFHHGQIIEIRHGIPSQTTNLQGNLVDSLKDILDWIYEPPNWQAYDRLKQVQDAIGDALDQVPEQQRLDELFQKALRIKETVKWHWDIYNANKIETYNDVIKEFENYLSQKAGQYDAIQKTLSDSLIAAIAVIIGSFIASFSKEPFNPFIFRVSTIAYAIYMLSIPLLYNMSLQWKKYRSYKDQSEARKRQLGVNMPQNKIEEIWRAWRMDNASALFASIFWQAVTIYFIVIIILLIAAWLVPEGVNAGVVNLVTPTISPVPTITPALIPSVQPTLTPTSIIILTLTP
jgi:hypothetical protein